MTPNNSVILLVDDSPSDIQITLHAFDLNNVQTQIDVVRDGVEALEYLFYEGKYSNVKKRHLAFILLDIKLPKINGIEVLEKIKSEPSTRHIPVIMLTASNQERDIQACYSLGVNSYIVKSVDFDNFSQTIKVLSDYWMVHNRQVRG